MDDHVGLGDGDSVHLSVAPGHAVLPTRRAISDTSARGPPNFHSIPRISQQGSERYTILFGSDNKEELTYDELCARFDLRIYTYIAPTMFKLKPSVESISAKDRADIKRESSKSSEYDNDR
jgi:hypothetical protein